MRRFPAAPLAAGLLGGLALVGRFGRRWDAAAGDRDGLPVVPGRQPR